MSNIEKYEVKVNTLSNMIAQNKRQLMKIAMPDIDIERALRVVLSEVKVTPKLMECSAESIIRSCAWAFQLGLEPGKHLKHVYLVPRYNKNTRQQECNAELGYKGLQKLAMDSGEVISITGRAFYENDQVEIQEGTAPEYIRVRRELKGPRGEFVGVYCKATFSNGHEIFDVMTKEDVDRIRATSPASKSGPWVDHYEAMAIKTVMKRLINRDLVQQSGASSVARAIHAEDAVESGSANVILEEFEIAGGGKTIDVPQEPSADPIKDKVKESSGSEHIGASSF